MSICLDFITNSGYLAVSKIVIDVLIDPTDHNLWPFELALYMMAAFIFSGAGVGLGWGMRKLLSNTEKPD